MSGVEEEMEIGGIFEEMAMLEEEPDVLDSFYYIVKSWPSYCMHVPQ